MTFTVRRGTNISHWLSQSPARGGERRRRFTREDCRRLADLGFDHLRLPVDEEQLWTEDGRQEPEAWDLLAKGLDWCAEDGMRAILDLHILRCHTFDAAAPNTLFTEAASAQHFAELWHQLSDAFRARAHDAVAYELLNEAVADDPEDWNRVMHLAYTAVREREPHRTIAIGSNRWGQPHTYPDLDVPANDPRLLLVFHYYIPMPITHYKASWVPWLKDIDLPLQYPGRPVPEAALAALPEAVRKPIAESNVDFSPELIERQIAPALAVARRTGLPLWCNEFGAVPAVPEAIRRAWYRDMLTVLDRHGIGWSNWDFRGSFGLFDAQNRPTLVVEALLGANKGR